MRKNFTKSSLEAYETISRYAQAGLVEPTHTLSLDEGILDINELDSLFVESEKDFVDVFRKEVMLLH